jgi:hypothetical protein
MTSATKQFIIALLCTIVVTVGVVLWYRGIIYLSAELATVESQLLAQTGQDRAVPTSGTALERLKEDEAFVQQYFVSEATVPAFINNLEARGRAQGATVTIVSVAKNGADLDATLALALTIKGTFDQVMQTLGAIEYAPYALTISSVALVREIKGSWKADLKLSVGSPPTLVTP